MEHKLNVWPVALVLLLIGFVAFAAGLVWSRRASGAETSSPANQKNVRVVYPKKAEVDLEAMQLEGEIRNPGEFYFQHHTEEKFDSLVKRRRNFQNEMLRDVVISK